jgi:restriction system protein
VEAYVYGVESWARRLSTPLAGAEPSQNILPGAGRTLPGRCHAESGDLLPNVVNWLRFDVSLRKGRGMAGRPRSSGRGALATKRIARQFAASMAADAARQRKEDERRARELYLRTRIETANERTDAIEQRLRELNEILIRALNARLSTIDFDRMKKPSTAITLDLGGDAAPEPAPNWDDYRPRPPGTLGRLLGGDDRHARRQVVAKQNFDQAVARHETTEAARQQRVRVAREDHRQRQAVADAQTAAQQAKVDRFAAGVRAGDRYAASRYFQLVIDRLSDPADFPRGRRVGYVPESSLLAIEWRMPGIDTIPADKLYKYLKTSDKIRATARPVNEVRQTYRRLVSQIALRALHAVFGSDAYGLVSTVTFNGMVRAIDRSTGQTIEPCLITLRATRDQFEPLVLREVDPVACVRKYFAADVSAHPEELQAVEPVLNFNMADPRIIDSVDIISEMDKWPNLLLLSAKEFESFVQNLFTRMGLDTKQYQANGDGGVDCIAYDRRAVVGGKYVIQAKLYTKTVPAIRRPRPFRNNASRGCDQGNPHHHQWLRTFKLRVRQR